MKELLFLSPIFKEMIWGSDKLNKIYGYNIPGNHTGECWAISANPSGDCKIASGTYKAHTLSWMWENHRELFGNEQGDRFPLLTKIIDAKNDLSIQVHPNDAYARIHEKGSLGKMECWYILDCEKDADIVIGHNAKCKEELENMILEGRWQEFIRRVPIKKGDFFQINPGTVHAIKGGTVILETQQNSDITYRVYDYDRLSEGKPRELHIEKSLEVITVPYTAEDTSYAVHNNTYDIICREAEVLSKVLVSCEYYTVWKAKVMDKGILHMNRNYMLVSVIEGNGHIDGIELRKGMHFIIPKGYYELKLSGSMELILSSSN